MVKWHVTWLAKVDSSGVECRKWVLKFDEEYPKCHLCNVNIKAIGGVQGPKYKLSSYESAFPYETNAFYCLLILHLVLKI